MATNIVGRRAECAIVTDALDRLSSGTASVVLIEGEAGIGKSSLAAHGVDEARRSGVETFVGKAHPLESTKPLGAMMHALGLLREEHPTWTPDSGVPYQAVDDVVARVARASAASPVLLLLEDIHWADPTTLLAVRGIVSELTRAPVGVILTARPAPRSSELAHLIDELLAMPADHVTLEPLGPNAVDELARAELGRNPDPALRDVITRSGGNPLWVVELIRAFAGGNSDWSDGVLPESLRDLVMRRLSYVPRATLDLLQIASVLGDRVSIGDLSVVARLPITAINASLGEAFRARIVGSEGDQMVFRHQLVQQAIYDSVPRPIRLALHRDAAGALARAGGDIDQVASHLLRGATAGDQEAVRWLRDAARSAAGKAPSIAVDLLRRVSELLPAGHADEDAVAADLVAATLRTGRVAEAAGLAMAILDRPHRREVDKQVRLALLETLSLLNRGPELTARVRETLDAGLGLTDGEHAFVLAQASYGRTFSGDVVDGERIAADALSWAERASDPAMTVWSLTTMSVAVKTQGRYAATLEMTERAAKLAFDPPNLAARLRHPLFFLAMAQSDVDRFDLARKTFASAARECDELSSVWLLPDVLLLSAELRFLVGEWEDASAELDSALDMAGVHGHAILLPQACAQRAVMAIGRGDIRGADIALAQAREADLDADVRYGEEMVAFAEVIRAEASGQATKAYDQLTRLWSADLSRDVRYYYRYLGPSLVRLAILLGDDEAASRAAKEVSESTQLAGIPIPSIESAAVRCGALVARDPDGGLEAVKLASLSGRFIDHLGACQDAASLFAAAGRTDEAVACWEQALASCEAAGAEAWAARAAAALRRFGVRRGVRGTRERPATGWQSLTRTELSVARLVAEGLTNREVAARLHVSPHTVNTHLRHIFQKLNVPNRARLAVEVAQLNAVDAGENHAFE